MTLTAGTGWLGTSSMTLQAHIPLHGRAYTCLNAQGCRCMAMGWLRSKEAVWMCQPHSV